MIKALAEIIKMQIKLPKSKHMAGDLRVCVVKIIKTHRSPCVVVEDLKTSGIRQTVVTNKSDRHYTQQQRLENTVYQSRIHELYLRIVYSHRYFTTQLDTTMRPSEHRQNVTLLRFCLFGIQLSKRL